MGEELGGPTCEDPGPGHMEGFLTPSSPRPKVSPESPAPLLNSRPRRHPLTTGNSGGVGLRGGGGGSVCRHPLPYAYFWEAVSKEIKSSTLLTGAKSCQPGLQLSLPRVTPALEGLRGPLLGRERCPCYVLGSVDAPLWGSPPLAPWSPFLSV